MNASNDLPDEMRRRRLDADTLDRLTTGHIHPDDAPPGYAQVAHLLRVAAEPPTRGELGRASRDIEAARSVTVDASSPRSSPEGRSKVLRQKRYRHKMVGMVAVGAILGTGGLAAAGVLPDAAQDVVSDALARVGLHVPAGDDHPAATGEEISTLATTTESEGVDKGAEISALASGGVSQAGQHGNPGGSDGDTVPAPSGGGSETASDASGGTSDAGTGAAGEVSDGRSDAGGGNAPEPSAAPAAPAPNIP